MKIRLKQPVFIMVMLFLPVIGMAQAKNNIYDQKENAAGVKKILIDGKFWVWTQKIGNGKMNVLLLHGGPGQTHEYFENFSKYLPNQGITIYYYDQFGSYFSQTPTQEQWNDTSIWKVSRYVEEIEQVRKGLHLEKLFILGHSYGSFLALAYTYKYQSNVSGMIFTSCSPYLQNLNDLNKRNGETNRGTDSLMSISDQYHVLMQNKNAGRPYDTALYQRGFRQFYLRNYLVRLDSLPESFTRTMRHRNFQVLQKIAPSVFSLNYAEMIKRITVPVLLISGEYDFLVSPGQIQILSANFRIAQYYIVPDGGHICSFDHPENYFPPLIKFIKKYQ